MLRKRKESPKPKAQEHDVGAKQVNGSATILSSKSSSSDAASKLNLILGFVLATFAASTLNLYFTRQLDIIGDIEDEISVLPQGDVHHSSPRPKVWIVGKKMETGYLRHVVESFERIGYELVNGSHQEWDVLWSHDYPFGKEFFTSLKPHQRVNHFPGSGYITNKVSLATSEMKHIPKAFHLPKDKQKFLEYAAKNPERLWVKKSNNHRGIGIEKVEEMDLDSSGNFVQEYIQNPLLVDRKKFDVGLYAVLTSIDPLRVYVYEKDVLLRFCQNKYYPFNGSDYDSYVVGDNYTPIWEIPSLSKYFTDLHYNMKQTLNIYLKSIGKDPEAMWRKMSEAIATVYKEKEEYMNRLASLSFKTTRNFFEMVRFDFLVDEDLNVYLMEANMSPNLSSLHFAPNKLLYEQVIFNLLSLVGLTRLDGVKDWPSYEGEKWDLRVSDKDLAVNEEICSSDECYLSCKSSKCRSCYMCLSDKMKLILKDAVLEQLSQWHSERLIPSTKDDPISPKNLNNQVQIDWFKSKCSKNRDWCSK